MLQPKSFLFDVGAEAVARDLRTDIQRLLLVFDVVHIPLGQFIFMANPFFRRVASLLIRDPGFQALATNGYVSVIFRYSRRRDGIRQYLDDYRRFDWRLTEPLSADDLRFIADVPVGFAFDNVLAGRFASEYLTYRLDETNAFFGSSFPALVRCFEDSLRSNDDVFIMEDFLSRIGHLGLRPGERSRLLHLLHEAYFINPDHAAPGVGDIPSFVAYEPHVTRKALFQPPTSPAPIRYLYSPSYVTQFFARWVPMREWAVFLTGDIHCIDEVRRLGTWDAFVSFYHERWVPKVSRQLREAFLWNRQSGPNFTPEALVDDLADQVFHYSEALAHIGGVVRLGSVVPLLLRNVRIRNFVDNWNRPAVRDFIRDFRHAIRIHGRLDG